MEIIPHRKILIDTGIANWIEGPESIAIFYNASDFQSYDGIRIVYWNWWAMNGSPKNTLSDAIRVAPVALRNVKIGSTCVWSS